MLKSMNIEVRQATLEDIATIKGQMCECTAILVEVLSDAHGELHSLAALLNKRTQYLEGALAAATRGDLITFCEGKIAFEYGDHVGGFGRLRTNLDEAGVAGTNSDSVKAVETEI